MCSHCPDPDCGFDEAMALYESVFGKFEIPEYDPGVDG